MDQFIGENIYNILQRVDLLFSEKVVPLITKVIEEQKQKITSDILAQIENSFIKKLNGEDKSTETDDIKINEPYFINAYEDEKRACYDYKINPKYPDYDYVELKKVANEIFSRIKNDKKFEIVEKIRTQPYHKDWNHWKDYYAYAEKLFEFFEKLHEGEYIILTYMEHETSSIGKIILITNFGSIYYRYYVNGYLFNIFNSNTIIPKLILDIFIKTFMLVTKCGGYCTSGGNIGKYFEDFKQSIIIFQKWWQSRPITGYTAELLKQENEKLKEEHQKIKHMYETLELKDQYHKAVELLKQNKKEREVLDQDRREFYREREESRREIEEKTKRYRQIKDIDTEITRLALIKQKLEKDRKDFEEEKAKFEEIRNNLM